MGIYKGKELRLIHQVARDKGFTVLRNLCSHGVGKKLHEYPVNIYNFENDEQADLLEEGMVIAIEPYISSGAVRAISTGNGYSFTTHNRSVVAQFEHTVLVTSSEAEIITKIYPDFLTSRFVQIIPLRD